MVRVFFSLLQVTWLSKWDGLLAGTKYMMLAASSSFKGKSDVRKYDKAMKLKGFIGRIREDYTKKLSSGDKRTKQVCCGLLWFVFRALHLVVHSFLSLRIYKHRIAVMSNVIVVVSAVCKLLGGGACFSLSGW